MTRREINRLAPPPPLKHPPGRRRLLSNTCGERCLTCDRIREDGDVMFPSHDASDRCESGKHSHCSCDCCF